jgi:hypothetical protein
MKKKLIIISSIVVIFLAAIVVLYKTGVFEKFFTTSSNKISYIAFKKDSEDRWGLMDMNGKVLVEKEWEKEPSFASCGIVRVLNKDGLYEYYTAEAKPKKIGKEYKSAGLFSENLAAVSEEDNPIAFIDVSGKVVFIIKELDGELVDKVGHFVDGFAKFKTINKKWGFLNKEGKVAIKAKYDYASDFKDGIAEVGMKELKNKDSVELGYIVKYGFINEKGDEVIKIKKGIEYGTPGEGLIAFSDNEKNYGFINFKEEKIIKPDKDFHKVTSFNGNYASFSDGDKWGVIDKDGKTIERAKYEFAYCSNGLIYINDNNKVGFLSTDGKEVIKTQYDDGLPFIDNTTIVKDGKSFILIDKKGNQVGKDDYDSIGNLIKLFRFVVYGDDEVVQSNYFDANGVVNAIIKSLSLTEVNGDAKSSNIKDIMSRHEVKEEDLDNNSETFKSPSKEVTSNVSYIINFSFDDNVKSPIKVRKRSGSGYWAYSYDDIVGYKLNETAQLKYINYFIKLFDNAVGKGESLAKIIKDKFEKAGFKYDSAESNDKKYCFKNESGKLNGLITIEPEEVYFGIVVE